MKTYIYNIISFLLGCGVTVFLCFNMFILPAYFGQFSINVNTLEQITFKSDGKSAIVSSITNVYLPRELCIIKGLTSSVLVINKDVYKSDISKGFKLIDVEAGSQDRYCDTPLRERSEFSR